MTGAAVRFPKLRIGVVQELQRPTVRRPTAGPESRDTAPRPVCQRNRSSRAAKLARQTMLIENSKSLASIGKR